MIYEIDLREILPKLKGPLKEIVDMEIAACNEMVEIASGWPMPEVNIWFSKPLTDKYKEKYPGLKYIYLGDPKNWLEDYRDNENGAMVAAKY